jgi:hypothetical protein
MKVPKNRTPQQNVRLKFFTNISGISQFRASYRKKLVTCDVLLSKHLVAALVYKSENTAMGIRWADHTTPYIPKRWH